MKENKIYDNNFCYYLIYMYLKLFGQQDETFVTRENYKETFFENVLVPPWFSGSLQQCKI